MSPTDRHSISVAIPNISVPPSTAPPATVPAAQTTPSFHSPPAPGGVLVDPALPSPREDETMLGQ
eukprot:9956955-Prorocentrum_lima.AAC.1